ncbi:MAG: hypothetical protein AAGF24_12335 [Cyanobacteria bacterium P01_H01_bin.121]
MAEPKSRIMEHLARSTNNLNLDSVPEPATPTPTALPSDRKQRIKEHLSRSKGTFGMGASTDARRQRILSHVQQTMDN